MNIDNFNIKNNDDDRGLNFNRVKNKSYDERKL